MKSECDKPRIPRLCLLFAMMVVLLSAPTALAVEEPEAPRILRVGFEGMTVPCNWTQSDDSNGAIPITGTDQYLCGFEVAYMKQVCALAGYEIEAYKFDWDGLMMAVPSGKVDCAISMIVPTDDRRQTMPFTAPYYYADTVAVVRRDGPFAQADSVEDLRGARATSMLNTLWYSVQIDRIPDVNKRPAMESVPTLVVALQSDKVDVILLDRPTAEGVIAANADLVIAPMEGTGNFNASRDETAVAIGVGLSDLELLTDLNRAISQIPQAELEQMIDDACAYQPLEQSGDVSTLSFFEMVRLLIGRYGPVFLEGAGVAAFLAVFGTLLGTVIGCTTGAFSSIPVSSESPAWKRWLLRAVRGIVALYVWLFRGTPMMVQAMVIYYGAAQLLGWDMDPLWAGLFIVSINTGAYMSETMRGGIQSVDAGQDEGAEAIGMGRGQTMFLVILPQAFRSIIPQVGNYLISNIKDTSMLSVITVGELFYRGREAAGQYFRFFEVFLIVSCIYLSMTTVATLLLRLVEKKLSGPKNYDMCDNR